jgi:hypothetical protein
MNDEDAQTIRALHEADERVTARLNRDVRFRYSGMDLDPQGINEWIRKVADACVEPNGPPVGADIRLALSGELYDLASLAVCFGWELAQVQTAPAG